MLALVVPEIDVPYFSELARDVINAAAELGFRVMIDQTGHDHERERDLLTGADRTMLFDGILFSPLVTQRGTPRDERRTTSMPLVLLGEHDFDGRYDHVAIDNVRAAQRCHAVTCIDIGRTRIAAIGAQPDETYATPQQRTAGLRDSAARRGPDRPFAIAAAVHYRRRRRLRLRRGSCSTRSPRPDAIFCYSDLLAMGALRAVFDAGLRVPEDVAIIGIDDIEEGRYARPSLSTVSLDIPFIARAAIARIAARIDDPDAPAQEVVAPHALLVRESTVGSIAALTRSASSCSGSPR